jgi:tripartite-type tricarboxylate transporter receptor subunit TctC
MTTPRPYRRIFLATAAAGLVGLGQPGLALAAADYPTGAIRLICPFSAGGSADGVSRIMAEQLSKVLGQSVFVTNRPGAGGNVGTEYVKDSKPDGYTLLLAYDGTIVINPGVYPDIPFDVLKDFAPIGKIGIVPLLVIVNPDLPVKTLADLIELSKKTTGGMGYGAPGIGSTQQLMFELIKLHTDANFYVVPYGGAAPAIIDVIGGRLPMVGAALTDSLANIKAGKLKALSISSMRRSPYLPDVPTLAECGIKDVDVSSWHGLMAPAATPRPVLDKLVKALSQILKDPAVIKHLDSIGSIVDPKTPDEFRVEITQELTENAKLVKAAKIRVAN